jgi:hypothetical protein
MCLQPSGCYRETGCMVAGQDRVRSTSWKVKEMTIILMAVARMWVTLWWAPLYTGVQIRPTITGGGPTGKSELLMHVFQMKNSVVNLQKLISLDSQLLGCCSTLKSDCPNNAWDILYLSSKVNASLHNLSLTNRTVLTVANTLLIAGLFFQEPLWYRSKLRWWFPFVWNDMDWQSLNLYCWQCTNRRCVGPPKWLLVLWRLPR